MEKKRQGMGNFTMKLEDVHRFSRVVLLVVVC